MQEEEEEMGEEEEEQREEEGERKNDWGCLLYTSPSPRDFCRSRMPSSA